RLPGVARRELRADRLRVGVPEGAPSGGVLLRAAERVADGLLPSRDAREGRRAPRRPLRAGRRRQLALGLYHRLSQGPVRCSLATRAALLRYPRTPRR